MLDDEKGKYKLVSTYNNSNEPNILLAGQLNEIDKYIYDNKIKNVDELFKIVPDKYSYYGEGTYKFSLIYKYRVQKEKPILFYEDIKKLRNLEAIEEITESYFKNEVYNKRFMEKYVYSLMNIKKSNIVGYAWDLYREPMNENNFRNFFREYISELNTEKLSYVVNYSRLRDMYCTMKFLDHEYTNPVIYEEIEYIDNNENFKKR